MIISFAWTTGSFLSGNKSVTRRFWTKEYMERWWKVTQQNNGLAMAYDRSPRFKGKQIGLILVTQKPYLEKLSLVTDEEEKKEGGLWGSGKAYMEAMFEQGKGDEPYVVRFEKLPQQK